MPDTAESINATITALEVALTRHTHSVQMGDRTVTYASRGEVLKALEYFRGRLNELTLRPRQFLGTAGKGL